MSLTLTIEADTQAQLLERLVILAKALYGRLHRPKVSTRIKDILYQRQRCRCALCGERLVLSQSHADHITPRSLGGSDSIDNFQLVHDVCNIEKGNMDPIEHAQNVLGRLL